MLPPPLNPPVAVRLTVLPDVDCPYLPGKVETVRAIMASGIDGATYQAFMDVGFRRSGRMLYQPICRDCRECRQIRLQTKLFQPTTSQWRCRRKNADLRVEVGLPDLTAEKFDLYSRYVRDWHAREAEADPEKLREFLYDSPTDTAEFTYRDSTGKLLAVGICDIGPDSLSSVYFYFDPAEAHRSLGTFGAIHEIEWAAARGLSFYYLGYWVRNCRAMTYKANFRPAEILSSDGSWQSI